MSRGTRMRWGCLLGLLALCAAVILVPWQSLIWDGGFSAVECRLKFVDGEGKPVPGVALTVLTRAGGVSYFYPVDELIHDRPVMSDKDGVMVFHHAERSVEFSGREYINLIGMSFGQTESPHYDCVFTLDGREVFRTRFNFHWNEWKEFHKGTETRWWWSPGWEFDKYGWKSDEDFETWRLRTFDSNKDGKLDREEAVAATYQANRLEDDLFWVEALKAGRVPNLRPRGRESSFLVVERTIVISTP